MASRRQISPMDHPVVHHPVLIFAVIGFMYLAAEVLKPLALAILLSFALVPISKLFERLKLPRAGRRRADGPARAWAAWARSATRSAGSSTAWPTTCPKYEREYQRDKIKGLKPGEATMRSPRSRRSSATWAGQLTAEPARTTSSPGRSRSSREPELQRAALQAWSGRMSKGVGTAFIILILLLFLMIGREDMSDRLIRAFGHGKISLTTRTMEEVGQRISKYLVMFATVNSVVRPDRRPGPLGDRRPIRPPLGVPGRIPPLHPLRGGGHGVRPAPAVHDRHGR